MNFVRTALLALALLPSLSFFPPSADAGDQKRGVLPDGRAFRVDDNGNELVDYIAELEVSVDNLQRRLYGCEDQLAGNATGGIEERDIGSTGKKKGAEPTCPVCPTGGGAECDARIKEVQSELAKLKASHERELGIAQGALQKAQSADATCGSKVSDLQNLLTQSRQDLAQAKSDALSERESLRSEIQKQQAEMTKLSTELEGARARLAGDQSNREKLDLYQAKIDDLELQLKRKEEEVHAARTQRVSAREGSGLRLGGASQPSSVSDYSARSPGSTGGVSAARERVVNDLRSQITGDLERAVKASADRDKLFANFDQKGRAVQIRPSAAISARGETLDSLRQEIPAASSVRELLLLRQDIQEISRKLNDDIATVHRLRR